MKDGTIHLAQKVEHAVDMDSGAVVGVTFQTADQGDTTTIRKTFLDALFQLADATNENGNPTLRANVLREVIADKGYHSGAALLELTDFGIRTYIAEPDRGKRNWKVKWEEHQATYSNRRRIRGNHGKAFMREHGELVERSFAHCYETGGMRRLFLRRQENITKRLLVHISGFNMSMVMRRLFRKGNPRGLGGLLFLSILGIHWILSTMLQILGDQFRCPRRKL